jgi:hypothetical protein
MKHVKLFEKFVEEMAETDIHYKNVIAHWEKSDEKEREKMCELIGCKDLNTLKKILRDMGYAEIVEIEKELGIKP